MDSCNPPHTNPFCRGVSCAQEMRVEMEALDARGARSDGARLVARAWVDREFRSLLLQVHSCLAGPAPLFLS